MIVKPGGGRGGDGGNERETEREEREACVQSQR